jgi:hypothetical protein
VETYAVLGGMPYYLISVDAGADLLTNVRRAVLQPTGSLFNEIPLQLHLEMQGMDVPLYNWRGPLRAGPARSYYTIGARVVELLGEAGVSRWSGQGGDHFAQALDGVFGLVRPVGRV